MSVSPALPSPLEAAAPALPPLCHTLELSGVWWGESVGSGRVSGVEYGGVEWSGVWWSGVEWSGN